jgi:hypothetical protein
MQNRYCVQLLLRTGESLGGEVTRRKVSEQVQDSNSEVCDLSLLVQIWFNHKPQIWSNVLGRG